MRGSAGRSVRGWRTGGDRLAWLLRDDVTLDALADTLRPLLARFAHDTSGDDPVGPTAAT